MVLLVVEPVEHRGILGQTDEEVAVVPQAVLAEHGDLFLDLVGALDLVVARGEDLVPEEADLLLEGALGVDHAIEPVDRGVVDLRRALGVGVVPVQQVLIDLGLLVGVEEPLDGRVVPVVGPALDFVAACAEPGAPQEVCHQGDFLLRSHRFLP